MPESLPGATTALREELEREKARADDMERIGNAKIAKWQTRAEKAESALAAANARAEKAEQLVCDFQAAAMIDVGNMGGPCAVEPRHVEKHVTELREALAAARRECEGLRAALSDLIQEMNFGGGCDGTDPSCDGCVAVEAARAALAAPADGEKKAPEAECAGCRYGFSIGMDGRHWYTGGTGSNVSMDCAKRPRKP